MPSKQNKKRVAGQALAFAHSQPFTTAWEPLSCTQTLIFVLPQILHSSTCPSPPSKKATPPSLPS